MVLGDKIIGRGRIKGRGRKIDHIVAGCIYIVVR